MAPPRAGASPPLWGRLSPRRAASCPPTLTLSLALTLFLTLALALALITLALTLLIGGAVAFGFDAAASEASWSR